MTEPLRQYADFVQSNFRFLMFGVLMTLGSSYGQTYFIAIFNAEIRQEYGLSHGEIGTYYSIATVLSAVVFVWVGRLIDSMSVRNFSTLAILGLACASFLMSLSNPVALLPIVFFGLRLAGQGLMTHAAITAAAKAFDARRGTALSLISLGFPLGQAIFPIIGVMLIASIGWRQTWFVFSIALLVCLLPTILFLLGGEHSFAEEKRVQSDESDGATSKSANSKSQPTYIRHWTRKEVLRDSQFYLLQPAALAMPIIATGIIWNVTLIAESKSWNLELVAASLSGLAFSQAVMTIISGPLIDRFRALPLLPISLLPAIVSLLLLAFVESSFFIFPIMLLLGLSLGLMFPVSAAIWAELYGLTHLGAIRALTQGLAVFGTALSPALMGLLTDWGISIEVTAFLLAAYAVSAGALALVVCGLPSNSSAQT